MTSLRTWLKARWDAFGASFDTVELLAGSDPRGTTITVGGMLLFFGLLGYAPPLSEYAEFEYAWVSMVLALLGAVATTIAYRKRFKGVGQVATLLDNVFYSASIVFAAVHSREGFGIGMAALHALAFTMFQARFYGLTLISAVAFNLPAAIGVIAFDAPASVRLILAGNFVLVSLTQHITAQRLQRQRTGLGITIRDSDAMDPATQARALVGTKLGNRWTLIAPLGMGGMGAVFEAKGKDGSRVAIKLLHRHLSGQASALRRLRREARLAASIEHPDVVKIHECEIDEVGSPYLVMELLEGESLQQLLEREQRLPPAKVNALAKRLLDIMAAAHQKNVLHRDLKPSNLFLTKAGALKVLDFGLARGLATEETLAHVSTVTGSLTLLGTPGYMAPEVARGRTELVDVRTDVWAIGATLFTLLSGRTVHVADTINELLGKAMTSHAPRLADVVPAVPKNLTKVVQKALSYEMGDRYRSVEEMHRDLLNGHLDDDREEFLDQDSGTRRLVDVG